MNEARGVAIWLLPEPAAATRLRALVERLARRFDTPVFEPHVTLAAGDIVHSFTAFERVVAQRFAEFQPRTFDIVGTGGTADRFTALYLAFEAGQAKQDFTSALACGPNLRGPRIGPHLSLLYRECLTDDARRDIVAALEPELPARILFDRIALVWPAAGDWSDVPSWRTTPIVR